MEAVTFDPVEMSRGISEYGFMIVASACFLLTSVTIMFLFFRWHTRILNSIIDTQQQSLKEILQSLKELMQSSREQSERQKEQGRKLEEIKRIVKN